MKAPTSPITVRATSPLRLEDPTHKGVGWVTPHRSGSRPVGGEEWTHGRPRVSLPPGSSRDEPANASPNPAQLAPPEGGGASSATPLPGADQAISVDRHWHTGADIDRHSRRNGVTVRLPGEAAGHRAVDL